MRYQLRHAAGIYWLLDTDQEGIPYKKPLPMNEMGAAIWEMMVQGMDKDRIVEALCREYQVAAETVKCDVEQFRAQLAEYGIHVADHAVSGRKD